MEKPIISIIGLGKVGQTLTYLFHENGYEVGGIYNRHADIAIQLSSHLRVFTSDNLEEVIKRSELIFLCVSDDSITSVVAQLPDVDWNGKALVHTSGVKSIDELQLVANLGGMIGTFHPASPIADMKMVKKGLEGTTFAIEFSTELLGHWLKEIVYTLSGQLLTIPHGKKSQYHLALVIASNYTVTLYAVAQQLLSELSDDDDVIESTLNQLTSHTINNLKEQGIPNALTGPLSRGDAGTIVKHLETLRGNHLLTEAYMNLARLSYPMLIARGIDIEQIDKLFEER